MKPPILIVDDLDNNLTATAGLLADMDAEMVLARNGREALLQMSKREFAMVLLDAHMPDMDGFEVIKLMSGVHRTRTTPIIFMSAVFKDDQHALIGYDLGAVDYLVKPFPPEFLRAKVKVFLELFRHKERVRIQDQEIKLFRNLLDESSDEIMIFDTTTGLLQDGNTTAFLRLGMTRDEAINTFHLEDCSLLVGHEYDLESLLTRIKQQGRLSVEGQYWDAAKQIHHTEANLQLFSQTGQTFLLALLRDVTKRKQTEMALIQAQAQAEQASQAKSAFLAAMSHEIRTPMNIVIGMCDVLLDTELNKQQKHYVSMLNTAGNNLLLLINDILDLSQIEANQLHIHTEPVHLQKEAEEMTNMLQVLAHNKGLELELRMDPRLPEWILLDTLRFRQCLYNLVSNGLKFTQQGWVTIDIGLREESPPTFQCTVSDSGIGIQAHHLEKIFELFTQSDSGIARRYGGTGLGLSLTKRLLEMMGGRIWIESQFGQGSQFHFTLPLRPTSPFATETIRHDASRSPKRNLPPLKILLVEDVLENRLLIKTYLENTPHQLTMAYDGAEGVKHMQQEAFDLVLMDIEMPVMDGLQATRLIREWEQAQKTRRKPLFIVALSAHSMKGAANQCLLAGCNDHLGKPINKKTLLTALETYCEQGLL